MNFLRKLFSKHPKYMIVGIAVIIVAALFFYCITDYYAAFTNNIIPELVGIVIELVLIIFVLDLIVEKQELKKSRKLEQRARDYLRFIIINLMKNEIIFNEANKNEPLLSQFKDDKHAFKFYAKDRENSEKIILSIKDSLDNLDCENVILHIKNHAKIDLPFFHSMTPVLAQVSGKHLKKWSRIIYFMTLIESSESTIESIKTVLEKIIEFDLITSERFEI
jgi:hypothetical protein